MKPALGAKAAVAIITVLLALYLVMAGRQSFILIAGGDWLGKSIGVALIFFPVLAAVFISREILWGFQVDRLLRMLADAGELPADDLPKHPSGRPVREAADADFPQWKAAVEAAPDDWKARFRLGLAYSASGDKRRAREAMRAAVAMERAERRAARELPAA